MGFSPEPLGADKPENIRYVGERDEYVKSLEHIYECINKEILL